MCFDIVHDTRLRTVTLRSRPGGAASDQFMSKSSHEHGRGTLIEGWALWRPLVSLITSKLVSGEVRPAQVIDFMHETSSR